MLLAIEAGHTNVKFALFQDGTLRTLLRIPTTDVLEGQIPTDFTDVTEVVIASVVPGLEQRLKYLCQDIFQLAPLCVQSDSDMGLEIRYQPVTDVGVDRLLDGVAAAAKYGAPCVTVGCGTATVFNVLAAPEEPGGRPVFLGGAIGPGIALSVQALYEKAPKLPRVQIALPSQIIAQTTVQALQSGILYGYAAQIDGMVRHIQSEINATGCPVILTGGNADWAQASETVTATELSLTLEGLRLVYEIRKRGSKADWQAW